MNFLRKYFWNNLQYKIRDFCWPRNKWLTKNVPNNWCDKDYLVETVLANVIVHYVEEEKAFEMINWDHGNHKYVRQKFENAYHWFKWQRPALEEKEDRYLSYYYGKGFNDLSESSAEFFARQDYDLEKRKIALDNYHLGNIVKYRQYLWT